MDMLTSRIMYTIIIYFLDMIVRDLYLRVSRFRKTPIPENDKTNNVCGSN